MVAIPTVYTQISHNPVVGFSLVCSLEFTYVRITDMTIIPACFRRGNNLRAGLPYVTFFRRNSLVQVHVIYNLERIAVLAYKSVPDTVFILDDAWSIVIVACTATEFISDLWSDYARLISVITFASKE
jgi:hypothetical protein